MANLSRIDPFRVRALDPFENVLQGFFRPILRDNDEAPQMKMDVQEDEQKYTIHAEIPGVDKENIQVTINGGQVSINAEVRRENEVKDKDGTHVLRSERYYGKVSRSFMLDNEVDEEQATANYKDGVLELMLPKKTQTAAKKLTIN